MFQLQISKKIIEFQISIVWNKIKKNLLSAPKKCSEVFALKTWKKIWKKNVEIFFERKITKQLLTATDWDCKPTESGKQIFCSDLFCSVSVSVSDLFVLFLLLSLFLNLFLSFNKRSTHHFIYFAWLKHEFEDFAKNLFVKGDLQGTNNTIIIG